MARRRRRSKYYDIVDSLYSGVVIGAIVIWVKTSNIYYGILAFIAFWIIFYGAIAYFKSKKNKKLLKSGIDIVDKMDGIVFEKFLLENFKQQGYKGRTTPSTADYGADIILQKDNRTVVVQAKRWKNIVGIEAIQQVIGAVKHYNADKGMVITNSAFTENAYNLAETNGIELWDRKKLIEFLNKAVNKQLAENVSNDLNTEVTATIEATCPLCSKHLVVKNGRRGKFWGCSEYPNCRFTKDY